MGYYPKRGQDTLRFAEYVSDDPARPADVMAVAARVRLLTDPTQQSLIWFLAGLSSRAGGWARVSDQLVRMFPGLFDPERTPRYLATFCVNPEIELKRVYFKADKPAALLEFQRRHREQTLARIVKTEVAQRALDTLEFGLELGRMVLIQGAPGIGKTTAAQTWCEANAGNARFVSLSGTLNRTTFFQALARALGLPAASTTPPAVLQTRIEDVLHACPLLICFDEAQHLWVKPERNRSTPELLEWVNTALYNHEVPVALVASPQFSEGLAAVEELSHWNSDQFKSRLKRFTVLPAPEKKDVEAVAEHLLPDATEAMRQAAVSFALCTRHPMRALLEARDEATHLARKSGRVRFTARDLAEALRSYCLPSEEAKGRMVNTSPAGRLRQPRRAFAAPLRPGGSQAAEDTFGAGAPVNRTRLSGPELVTPELAALG